MQLALPRLTEASTHCLGVAGVMNWTVQSVLLGKEQEKAEQVRLQ